uniref:Uncharacterized protein n=1 Tax=Anguilla anguilla TaxID=7936 RepID=A0A0E9X8I1_ANGAN
MSSKSNGETPPNMQPIHCHGLTSITGIRPSKAHLTMNHMLSVPTNNALFRHEPIIALPVPTLLMIKMKRIQPGRFFFLFQKVD